MASSYKALQIWVTHFCEERANEEQLRPQSWRGCLYSNHLSYPRILTLFIEWLRFLVLVTCLSGENRKQMTRLIKLVVNDVKIRAKLYTRVHGDNLLNLLTVHCITMEKR